MNNEPVKRKDITEKEFKIQFGEILKSQRETLNLSRNASSIKLNVANSTLQAWEESGERTPNAWDIYRIINEYNITLNDLYGAFLEALPVEMKTNHPVTDAVGNKVDLDEFCFIPRYNVYASAGHGCDVSQETYMHSMAFRKYWIDNVIGVCVKDLIVIGVKGDSMEGEINDGDVILINTADKHLNNGIYVIRIDGDLIVKHIQKLPGNKIRVSSTNKIYDPFDIDLNNQPTDFGAIGRVVWHGRNVP